MKSLIDLLVEIWNDHTWLGRLTMVPIWYAATVVMVFGLLIFAPVFLLLNRYEEQFDSFSRWFRGLFVKHPL